MVFPRHNNISPLVLWWWLVAGSSGSVVVTTTTTAFSPIIINYHYQKRNNINRGNTMPIRLGMISNLFKDQENKKQQQQQLPRDVKDAVSQCREATQNALQDRISRMDIEFPVGTKFGVEKGGTSKNKKNKSSSNSSDATPTKDDLERSDRELTRLFVDMFQPVGGENLVAVFCDVDGADMAKKQWKGDSTASCRILSMDRRKKGTGSSSSKQKKKKNRAKGFAAKMAAEIEDEGGVGGVGGPFQLPENTEVALFVAPGPKELVIIEKICKDVGMGTLVVLLNARLSSIQNFGTTETETLFRKDFEPVFHLAAAAPQEVAPGCLLFRKYQQDWQLARKPTVGQPKTILSQSQKPTTDECQAAYKNLELSDVEKNVENAMENVANWFR